jgi:uncharacterized spore protein YtfJ
MDLDALLEGHRDAVSARKIYGDPVERDGVTVVPAASFFGGAGGGGDDDGNGGTGIGLAGRPAGAWVIRDGEVTWKPAVDLNRVALFTLLLGIVYAIRRRRN